MTSSVLAVSLSTKHKQALSGKRKLNCGNASIRCSVGTSVVHLPDQWFMEEIQLIIDVFVLGQVLLGM